MTMDCSQTRACMDGYLDRELDPLTAAAVEAHLGTCAACAQAYTTQTTLRNAIRKETTYYTSPDALAARIRAKTGVQAGAARKTTRRWSWFPLGAAVAAIAVIMWTTTIQMESGMREERIVEQVIAGHARSVMSNHLVEVASSDQHTVRPWLSSKLDFSPPAIDLTAAGFPLVGARLDYVNSRPVAALVYRHRAHVINLFVWPDDNAGRASQTASKQGYTMLHWNRDGMSFWAISDLNAADLRKFSETYTAPK